MTGSEIKGMLTVADLTDRPDVSALGVSLVSEGEAIDLDAPLAGRWIRYWPGPYGRKRKDVPFLDRLDANDASQVAKNAARREALRLVYVGWTRARERGRPQLSSCECSLRGGVGHPPVSAPGRRQQDLPRGPQR